MPLPADPAKITPAGSVYVKKWMRTSHATMFRLSNKIVQVNFKDHTEILLNSESRIVTYVNKRGESSVMPLSQALDSNDAEMTKRLKYTKDILTTMLNNGTVPANGQSVPQSRGSGLAMNAPLTTIGSRRSDVGSGRAPSLTSGASDRRMIVGGSSHGSAAKLL